MYSVCVMIFKVSRYCFQHISTVITSRCHLAVLTDSIFDLNAFGVSVQNIVGNDLQMTPLGDYLLLVQWCDSHYLLLNVSKTKELVFDFRKAGNLYDNNNHRFYIAPFQLFQLLKALHNVLLPQRPLHSRDRTSCEPT